MGVIKRLAVVLACAALTACGLADGLTTSEVVVKRSPGNVLTPLLQASVSDAERYLPGVKVVKSRPSDRELLYTFPGDGKQDPATVLIAFEPLEGGKATRVVTTVSVPPITMMANGQKKVLSGKLVGAGISRVIAGMVNGKNASETSAAFSSILTALAISTDADLRAKALGMTAAPQMAMSEIMEREAATAAIDRRDGNDSTEFDTPLDESEQFSPEREEAEARMAAYRQEREISEE